MACETCKHWAKMPRIEGMPDDAPDMGACRRFPPTPVVVVQQVPRSPMHPNGGMVNNVVSQFPVTPVTEDCGEFAPRTANA